MTYVSRDFVFHSSFAQLRFPILPSTADMSSLEINLFTDLHSLRGILKVPILDDIFSHYVSCDVTSYMTLLWRDNIVT